MTLVACDECRREISDRAAACPQCGAPARGPARTVATAEGGAPGAPGDLGSLREALARAAKQVMTELRDAQEFFEALAEYEREKRAKLETGLYGRELVAEWTALLAAVPDARRFYWRQIEAAVEWVFSAIALGETRKRLGENSQEYHECKATWERLNNSLAELRRLWPDAVREIFDLMGDRLAKEVRSDV